MHHYMKVLLEALTLQTFLHPYMHTAACEPLVVK
jgi:hypothetical protein